MAGIEEMVHLAEKSLGIGEPNYIQRWYSESMTKENPHWAWCDAAISYWAWQSGNKAAVTFGDTKYVGTVPHANAFKAHGKWHVDTAGVRRGDIVFFDWQGSNSIGAIDHVGLVTGVSGRDVSTIEGNTKDQSGKYRCLRHVRRADHIAGYGRPAYTGAPAPGKPALYEPFPGAGFFTAGRKSPIIAACHNSLMAAGCNRYKTQTNIDTWGSGDVASYAAWQRKCGYSGADANGVPGATSWDRLHVKNV